MTEIDPQLPGEIILLDFPEQDDPAVEELLALRKQRRELQERIEYLTSQVALPYDDRPTWGPCTRCGHTWKGHWANHPPRGCARCGSTGWAIPPQNPNARVPSDPPNPRWNKNRKTGKPTDPENVLGRKTRKQRAAAKMIMEPAIHLPDRELMNVRPLASPLTPPPKLAEVAPALVPKPEVRFAEPFTLEGGASSTVERNISNVEVAGSSPASRSTSIDEVVFPAPEADPTVDYARVEDENTHEVRWVPMRKKEPDGNDAQ